MAQKLCEACHGTLEGQWQTSDFRDDYEAFEKVDEYGESSELYHHNVSRLEASAESGCSMCTLILHELERISSIEDLQSLRGNGQLPARVRISSPRSRDDMGSEWEKDMSMGFEYVNSDASEHFDCYLRIRAGRSPQHMAHKFHSDKTWSKESLVIAVEWVQRCRAGEEGHNRCSHIQSARRQMSGTKNNFLPTRLIEISRTGSKSRIRLREKQYMTGNEQYMTLSHCWGEPSLMKCKLSKSNWELFCNEIGFSTLPRTFQDAIHVAQSFAIKYIWIDALCIIQDSREDWLRESAMMADTYASSFLNIAATATINPHGGLFHSREKRQVPEDVVNISTTWNGRLAAGQYACYGEETFRSEVNNAPLYRRGWVVQERLLAPRILHFAANHLFWECSSFVAMESLPGGIYQTGGYLKEQQSAIEIMDWPNFNLFRFHPHQYWSLLISEYSACHLTHSSDKMIAISALAQLMHSFFKAKGTEDVYLAGLWKSNLLNGLSWRTIGSPGEGIRIQSATSTPSWSWACIHSANVYIPGTEEYLPQSDFIYPRIPPTVVKEACTFPIAGEFGLVKGGILRLQGPLCKVKAPIYGNIEDWTINGSAASDHFSWLQAHWDVRSDCLSPPADLALMMLGSRRFHGDQNRVEGLLLSRTKKKTGQYTRVGLLELEAGDNDHIAFDDFNTLSCLDLPSEYYEEKHENSQYTILVI